MKILDAYASLALSTWKPDLKPHQVERLADAVALHPVKATHAIYARAEAYEATGFTAYEAEVMAMWSSPDLVDTRGWCFL